MENDDHLRKELKACRLQLQHAERRAAVSQESRDSLGMKLEEATDEMAELQRRLEVAAHQTELLSKEVAEKDAALVRAGKERGDIQASLNAARVETSKLNETVTVTAADAVVQKKAAKQVEITLTTQQEQSTRLQKRVDTLLAEQTKLKSQIIALDEQTNVLKKEAAVTSMQMRTQGMALASTEAALQQAHREAADAGRAYQASQDAKLECGALRKELTHLGIELLREQAAAENPKPSSRGQQQQKNAQAPAPDDSSPLHIELKAKIAALHRRLIIHREQGAVLVATLQEKEEEIARLKRSLELRMEGDEMQHEITRLRTQLSVKIREERGAKAEAAALREELAGKKAPAMGPREKENNVMESLSKRVDGSLRVGNEAKVVAGVTTPRAQTLLPPHQLSHVNDRGNAAMHVEISPTVIHLV